MNGKKDTYSIIVVGVGGQGTLLASKILSVAAINRGLFVRTSETIGMAQRGGSVASHIRIGAENLSPVIPCEAADIVIAFELAEALRIAEKFSADVKAVVNREKIVPTNVSLGRGVYKEEEYIAYLNRKIKKPLYIEGTPLAVEAGNSRALNVVLLGTATAAGMLPFSEAEMKEALKLCVKPKTLEINLKAFERGVAAGRSCGA